MIIPSSLTNYKPDKGRVHSLIEIKPETLVPLPLKSGNLFSPSCVEFLLAQLPERLVLRLTWPAFLDSLEQKLGGFEWFATFTFKEDVHQEQANKRYFRFIRKVNEEVFGRRYREKGLGIYHIRALEYQKRGVIHFHSLIGGGVSTLHRLTWKEIWLNSEPGNGFARVMKYDPTRGAKGYLGKYVTKGAEIDIFLSPRYEERLRGLIELMWD